MDFGTERTVYLVVFPGRYPELLVETLKEVAQHPVGIGDGGSSRQAQFCDQPVLEGAVHTFHTPFDLR